MKKYIPTSLIALLIIGFYLYFPALFKQVVLWQRDFNQIISAQLHQIKQTPTESGITLITVSFLYGVFHAIGPGHGKFVIASYLSTHESKLKSSMKLTFFSSLMQGIVAVIAVSILVVALQLSSNYFKTSQLWLERVALFLMLLLGVQWMYQAIKMMRQSNSISIMNKSKPYIHAISIKSKAVFDIPFNPNRNNAKDKSQENSYRCHCGHQHLPNAHQLQAQSWKSQLLIILTIGMRPCSGAIFVLFLAYMLDLYFWGVIATMGMALGTGLMLSGFAVIVQYARQTAIQMSTWYGSVQGLTKHGAMLFKFMVGILIFAFAALLFYTTFQPTTGGAILFNA
ncbi:ABC transporter permease [Actinobacillus porcinus]|uniref:Nickel/cobalt efflux system n=2 Tax=Actinobacillus porcinus TaxID=51048 RepID=A0ABY6TIA1_9PAST|nr:ABC transporter permease [Actinobacillus porcinus]VTU06904.1 ABC transporter permease [Actinobacillus porcinus]